MKIYAPAKTESGVNGGLTFLRNLKKGLADRCQFVNSWQEADIFFITSVTLIDLGELLEAKKAGKKIVFRVDNVPRNSRNKRLTPKPAERMKMFAGLADLVIYQSEWARAYCSPLCGDGTVVYNGVDQEIFYPDLSKQDPNKYLFLYHGKNELKQFWLAHFYFHKAFVKNQSAEFYFINQFPSAEEEILQKSDYDFWFGEQYTRLPLITDPHKLADLMRQCKYLIFPSTLDAAPNTVLEARACGMEIIGAAIPELAGTQELMDPKLDISLERMCDEYYHLMNFIHSEPVFGLGGDLEDC